MKYISEKLNEVSMKCTALNIPDKLSVEELINRDESLPTVDTLRAEKNKVQNILD